jgi:hypothetical protein
MSDITTVVILFLPPLVLFVALMRAPRWFAGSLCRHAIWRLRDGFVDETLAGRLPCEALAVQETRRHMEWVLAEHTTLSMAQVYAWWWAWRKSPELRPAKPKFPNGELTVEQAQLLDRYNHRLSELNVASVLCSSWPGLMIVVRYLVPALVRGAALRPAANEAAREASHTDPGERASDYLGWKDSAMQHAMVA